MDFVFGGVGRGEGLNSYVLTFNSLTHSIFLKDNICVFKLVFEWVGIIIFLIICFLTFSFSSNLYKFYLMKMRGRKEEFAP
jgi:dolichol kinase